MPTETLSLHVIDYIAIGAYIVILVTIGMLRGGKLLGDEDFFLLVEGF